MGLIILGIILLAAVLLIFPGGGRVLIGVGCVIAFCAIISFLGIFIGIGTDIWEIIKCSLAPQP